MTCCQIASDRKIFFNDFVNGPRFTTTSLEAAELLLAKLLSRYLIGFQELLNNVAIVF